MSKWGWGETLGLIGIVIAIAAFAEPEVRCMVGLGSESCPPNTPKNDQPTPVVSPPVSPNPTTTRFPNTSGKYAAIAYSVSTDSSGYAHNYTTLEAAQRRALRECESRSGAGDCQSVVSARNSCAALATASNRAFGWAHNNNLFLAQQNALQQCIIRGSNCEVRHSICSS